jgi:hypothetical protein
MFDGETGTPCWNGGVFDIEATTEIRVHTYQRKTCRFKGRARNSRLLDGGPRTLNRRHGEQNREAAPIRRPGPVARLDATGLRFEKNVPSSQNFGQERDTNRPSRSRGLGSPLCPLDPGPRRSVNPPRPSGQSVSYVEIHKGPWPPGAWGLFRTNRTSAVFEFYSCFTSLLIKKKNYQAPSMDY